MGGVGMDGLGIGGVETGVVEAAEVEIEVEIEGRVIQCSGQFISASARWKARVDSAPWFSLIRSTCNPSLHPPVVKS
jgi:hypothetical protein